MVIKKILILLFFFIISFKNIAYASQILDYETEIFIKSIIVDIKKINKINKEIKFVIVSDVSINAYVNADNIIHITSGLIEHAPDYVALLAVIAHEIGHIDLNHIALRKLSIEKLNKYKSLSNISIIAGSMISSNPEILKGVVIGNAGASNIYIDFSKEQETEADIYSLKTIKKLGIYSNSIIDLLNIIEKKALDKGLTKDKQKISTHPYFEDRIDLVNYLTKNNNENFNLKMNQDFNYIQAKFQGYNNNHQLINQLKKPFKNYAESIVDANNGNLINSLKKINSLIKQNINNIFFLETKADILFSYGYTKESIEFYKKVLKVYPANEYAQIRIFSNVNIDKLSIVNAEDLFLKNLNLLKKYHNNKNILEIYMKLAKKNDNSDWVNFLNFWINTKRNNHELIKKNLDKFSKTNDKNLLELINLIKSKYK